MRLLILLFTASSCLAQQQSFSEFMLKNPIKLSMLGIDPQELNDVQFESALKGKKVQGYNVESSANEFSLTFNSTEDAFRFSFYLYRTASEVLLICQYVSGYESFGNYSNNGHISNVKKVLPGGNWETLTSIQAPRLGAMLGERIALPQNLDNANRFLDVNFEKEGVIYTVNMGALSEGIAEYYKVDLSEIDTQYLCKNKYVMKWTNGSFRGEFVLNKDYKEIPTITSKKVELREGNPDITEYACTHAVTVKASSTLLPQGKNTYVAANMLDNLNSTGWCEGAQDYGVSQWVEFTITEPFNIGDSYVLINGYAKSETSWKDNCRVAKMNVLLNGKAIAQLELLDISQYQSFNLNTPWLKRLQIKKGDKIRFEILEVNKGNKYKDTLITYFVPVGNCG